VADDARGHGYTAAGGAGPFWEEHVRRRCRLLPRLPETTSMQRAAIHNVKTCGRRAGVAKTGSGGRQQHSP